MPVRPNAAYLPRVAPKRVGRLDRLEPVESMLQAPPWRLAGAQNLIEQPQAPVIVRPFGALATDVTHGSSHAPPSVIGLNLSRVETDELEGHLLEDRDRVRFLTREIACHESGEGVHVGSP